MPAGLRSQTPMNQTAAKPNLAMASHSAEGTELKSTEVPVFRLSSESQTQVLISYNVGYRGQMDMITTSSTILSKCGTAGAPVTGLTNYIPTAIIPLRLETHRYRTAVQSRTCPNPRQASASSSGPQVRSTWPLRERLEFLQCRPILETALFPLVILPPASPDHP